MNCKESKTNGRWQPGEVSEHLQKDVGKMKKITPFSVVISFFNVEKNCNSKSTKEFFL